MPYNDIGTLTDITGAYAFMIFHKDDSIKILTTSLSITAYFDPVLIFLREYLIAVFFKWFLQFREIKANFAIAEFAFVSDDIIIGTSMASSPDDLIHADWR